MPLEIANTTLPTAQRNIFSPVHAKSGNSKPSRDDQPGISGGAKFDSRVVRGSSRGQLAVASRRSQRLRLVSAVAVDSVATVTAPVSMVSSPAPKPGWPPSHANLMKEVKEKSYDNFLAGRRCGVVPLVRLPTWQRMPFRPVSAVYCGCPGTGEKTTTKNMVSSLSLVKMCCRVIFLRSVIVSRQCVSWCRSTKAGIEDGICLTRTHCVAVDW